jgi:hypothetical protein
MGAIGWGIVAALGGIIISAGGIPKPDRRFRTGYKNNLVPDGKQILAGAVVTIVGVVVALVGWHLSPDEPVPARIERAPDFAQVRDMATAPPDMAKRHKRKHAAKAVEDPQ